MKTTHFCLGLLVGLFAAGVGCKGSDVSSGTTDGTGGMGNGGMSASGGKNGSGGATGSGGTTSGQNSGGTAGPGAGGTGGNTTTTGQGGVLGGATGSGGQGSGGVTGSSATGGKATGGAAGGSFGTGGLATGGVPGTGGQGSGGKGSGGATGTGGTTTAGSTGGTLGSGGSATGGVVGTGGTTGTPAYRPCPTDGSPCKIMPFGDSISDGYNQNTPGGYRVELFRLAHSAGKNITFVGNQTSWGIPKTDGVEVPPKHEGHSGYTIYKAGNRQGIGEMVSTVMPANTPHIVLLMIGTNDAIDNYEMATASTRLKTLIESIYAQLPEVLIVVGQPIPSRGDGNKGDDTALSDRIKAFNATLPAVVKAQADKGKHILLVDMFTPFNPNKAALMEDQWHPNLAGYVVIGAEWYSVLKPLL